MKTIATVTFLIDWENKYDSHGDPDMQRAVEEFLDETTKQLFGYEWDLEHDVAYVEGPVEILNIETQNLDMPRAIKPLPFCEHCGEGHEEFGAEFDADGTAWCLNCYLSKVGKGYGHMYKFYQDMIEKAEVKHLEKRLKTLKKKK